MSGCCLTWSYSFSESSQEESEAHRKKGFQYFNEGRYAEAAQEFTAAIEDWETARARCVYSLDCEWNADAAERSFAALHGNRGQAYYQQKLYDEAIDDLNIALKNGAGNADLYVYRGFAYHEKGLYDEALADFDTALQIDSKDAFAYCGKGGIYDTKGRVKDAVKAYKACAAYAASSVKQKAEQRIKELEKKTRGK